MLQTIKTWFDALMALFFPDTCCICQRSLVKGESHICLHCLYRLPQTDFHLRKSNPAEERFMGKFICRRAASFLYFEKKGYTQTIVHRFKYKGDRKLAVWCGRMMGKKMKESDFFDGIDLIVPVPLHKKKMKKRGYNQSELLAGGLSEVCGIAVCTGNLIKTKNNTSQTKKARFERWLNSRETFMVLHPEEFAGKHILLIDDVLTTGSTLEACAGQILACQQAEVSILTLSIAR
jgi:ComF family protein